MTASASASLACEFCVRFASRANGMWVCPQTTVMTSSGSPARTSAQRSTLSSTDSSSDASRSSTSDGCGPAAMSPVSTIRSAARTDGSASTASSAGSTPWMSDGTASDSMPEA